MTIDLARLGRYLRRAIRLKCPLCGESPLYCPVASVRRVGDWFETLDGCPRCGYPYEREPGYWLLATFVINYGTAVLLGAVLYVLTDRLLGLKGTPQLIAILLPVALFSLLTIRHAKAIFLAFDRFIDPTG